MPCAQCTKNQPPIAGSIQWSRALMRRIKKPMLRFQSYEEIMNSTEGQNATKIYISVGKAMREYENKLEKEFLDSVERQAMGNLKENILPTRSRADLIMVKSADHTIAQVHLRKI